MNKIFFSVIALCFFTGLPAEASNTLSGIVDHLVFLRQPADDEATDRGMPWTTQPVVAIVDSEGRIATYDNSSVVNVSCVRPLGCSILGTTQVRAVNGVATFTDLRLGEWALGIVIAVTTPGNPQILGTMSVPGFNEN